MKCNKVDTVEVNSVNVDQLATEVLCLLEELDQPTQVSLTTQTGKSDDWISGNGYNGDPQRFNKINESLKGSYIEELINRFPDFSRWRIMVSNPKSTLTVHKDGWGANNYRIHIPVISNPNSWMVFYEHELCEGTQTVSHYQLKPGNIYLCDTTNYHTAVNYDHTEKRIHIIGEKNVRQQHN